MATESNDPVARSADIEAARRELRQEMRDMEERIVTRLHAKIAEAVSRAKFEMLSWGIGILLVNDALILAGMKLFI